PLRPPREDLEPHHQRGPRDQPRGVRHHLEAPRDDRVGMNVLLLGSGGREHAIAWRISQSPLLSKLWIAPGNAGTADLGENVVGVSPTDPEAVRAYAEGIRADLVVVSSDDPLAAGVVDAVTTAGIPAFGSTRAAA